MNVINRESVKNLLGEIPLAAELYWRLRQPGKPVTAKFDLKRLEGALPTWRAQVEASPYRNQPGKKVLLFATQRYWVEHITLVGMALAGLGHSVTIAYTPYAGWFTPIGRFDLRRQNVYIRSVINQALPRVKAASFLPIQSHVPGFDPELEEAVRLVSLRDTQYTLQMENVNLDSDLYRLRLERNRQAAYSALKLFESEPPDVVVIPNGTILEMGAVYKVARRRNLPVVTYEFGEQRQRVWLAQNAEVMRQETGALWQARKDHPLNEAQLNQVRQLLSARQRASLWENFARRWQGTPGEGGAKARATLKLDARPVVLLATNVIGDSLTLGRQVFSDSMTAWIERTIQYFARRTDAQLVIRIHPGELVTKGPSVAGVVLRALSLPETEEGFAGLPEHIHLVRADAAVNTYDIVEIADLGLVYTTTVGMEMAMAGVPVIVVGNTHYRARGFTLDPQSWEGYFELLDKTLEQPGQYRPARQQIEQAWNYAYRFFFEYPFPFPWHIGKFWEELKEWPLGRVLSEEGQAQFGATLRYLVGEAVDYP